MDRFSPEKRSEVMSRIRGKDTKPELTVRRLLHRIGFRFRLHRKDLPGRPDIVLPKWRTAIFVHGCFWHGHDCPRGAKPTTNTEFWETKIRKNEERDRRSVLELTAMGWRVMIIWDCELRDPETLRRRLESISANHG